MRSVYNVRCSKKGTDFDSLNDKNWKSSNTCRRYYDNIPTKILRKLRKIIKLSEKCLLFIQNNPKKTHLYVEFLYWALYSLISNYNKNIWMSRIFPVSMENRNSNKYG